MLLLKLQRLILCRIRGRSLAPPISLGVLRKTLMFLASMLIFGFMSFVFLYRGRLRDEGISSPWVSLLNIVPSWISIVKNFFESQNLSSIVCELYCWTMLYMLFNSLLAPCNPRVSHNKWKSGKTSGCITRGGIWGSIEGNQTDPSIRGVWTRFRCNKTSM